MSDKSIELRGPLSVSCVEVEGEWQSTALEFDLVGTGATRSEALNELIELVGEYLIEAINEVANGHSVAIYQPADAEEWNRGEVIQYELLLRLRAKKHGLATVPYEAVRLDLGGLRELSSLKDDIAGVELQPLSAIR